MFIYFCDLFYSIFSRGYVLEITDLVQVFQKELYNDIPNVTGSTMTFQMLPRDEYYENVYTLRPTNYPSFVSSHGLSQ
jgi:hypothetical protein